MTKVFKALSRLLTPFFLGTALAVFFAGLFFNYNEKAQDFTLTQPVPLFEAFETLHNLTIDYRLKFRGPRKGSEDVVVLTVDEKALEQYGRWPWPRRKIAKIVDTNFCK